MNIAPHPEAASVSEWFPWERGRPARIEKIAGGTPAVPGQSPDHSLTSEAIVSLRIKRP